MDFEFDAIKMETQVTLDRMIGSLKLETTDDVGERGGIPRCGRWVKCVEGECVICEEEREVETALHVQARISW
eukprot:scaffold115272_cov52-Attheya_sp.AAC.1